MSSNFAFLSRDAAQAAPRHHARAVVRMRPLALMLAGLFLCGGAMADLVIFSPVSGRVLLRGAPVQGAVVERRFHFAWGKEEGAEQVITGADGAFSFGLIQRRSFWAAWLPHEPHIRQTILVRHGDVVHQGWLHDKGDYLLDSEWANRPARLVCRLEATPGRQGKGFGICAPE